MLSLMKFTGWKYPLHLALKRHDIRRVAYCFESARTKPTFFATAKYLKIGSGVEYILICDFLDHLNLKSHNSQTLIAEKVFGCT